MSVHVLRAHGVIFSELTQLFGVNPARFHEILCGNLHPGSWEAAVNRLQTGEPWHPSIAALIERLGLDQVIGVVQAASPTKRQFQQQLKRLRKSTPLFGITYRSRRFLLT